MNGYPVWVTFGESTLPVVDSDDGEPSKGTREVLLPTIGGEDSEGYAGLPLEWWGRYDWSVQRYPEDPDTLPVCGTCGRWNVRLWDNMATSGAVCWDCLWP